MNCLRDVEFEERPFQPGRQHIARAADITLATVDDFQFGLDDPGYGFDIGPSDGIGSQDFDLDLDWDLGGGQAAAAEGESHIEDDSLSMEVGRDAPPPRSARESMDSHLLGRHREDFDLDLMSNRSRAISENPFAADMDFDFGPDVGGLDLGLDLDLDEPLDLGKTLSEHAPTPRLSPSRECEYTVPLH